MAYAILHAPQSPHWHQLALKLSCAAIILLLLRLTGFSILLGFLVQNPPTETCNVTAGENRSEPTGRTAIMRCPRDWHLYLDKCLFTSHTSRPWAESLADCSMREATLLLIQDEKELRFLQGLAKRTVGHFFIGLKYVHMEKAWKWINGSVLNPNVLQIMGKDEESSCAMISSTKVFSESCFSYNYWICQKKLKHV
ncbi:killer cell lectin-like receptor subfamily B member 1 [Acomys russatus]|uniref:killer cell lectin-like receptor subfamily B member 1 n=1 Tax=Acomys russatus TaxID=60746 RepID=UPI0021E24AF4|nr:killer cell lectin-like receptor subfamily B member 1 [Acomys russatus]